MSDFRKKSAGDRIGRRRIAARDAGGLDQAAASAAAPPPAFHCAGLRSVSGAAFGNESTGRLRAASLEERGEAQSRPPVTGRPPRQRRVEQRPVRAWRPAVAGRRLLAFLRGRRPMHGVLLSKATQRKAVGQAFRSRGQEATNSCVAPQAAASLFGQGGSSFTVRREFQTVIRSGSLREAALPASQKPFCRRVP